jgi:hypothetical protein
MWNLNTTQNLMQSASLKLNLDALVMIYSTSILVDAKYIMTKASNFVSANLQWCKLIKTPAIENIFFVSIYELRIAKKHLERKATLGYCLTCYFHQCKGDLASSFKFIA